MPSMTSIGGLETRYEIEHRSVFCETCNIEMIDAGKGQRCPWCGSTRGKLIYREASVMFPELPEAPPEPDCFTVPCINAYQKKFDKWVEECRKLVEFHETLSEYHSRRCQYCMKHRNDEIDIKYRIGEPAPQTLGEARFEIMKLK